MTIIISLVVPEGLVFTTDSRQTFTNSRGDTRVSSDNAYKLFQLGANAAASTYGWAFLLGRNIHSHINDFRITLGTEPLPIEEIAKQMGIFFNDIYQKHIEKQYDKPVQANTAAFGFLVGGFDPGTNNGKLYEIRVPTGTHTLSLTTYDYPGSIWRGQYIAISRLIKGYDPGLLQLPGQTPELQKAINDNLLGYKLSYWYMPLQEAIDLALFLTDTVIKMQRFADGTYQYPGESAACGGAVDVAVIEPENGFRWIQRKQLRGRPIDAIYSNGET